MATPPRNRNFLIEPPPQRRGARVTPIWNRYAEVLPVPMESNSDNSVARPLFSNANYNEENVILQNNPFQQDLTIPHFEVEYKMLPSVNVKANEIEVFDLLMGESTNINVNNLDKDLLYFKSKDSYSSLPVEHIETDINTNQNIFFKCNKELIGAPRVSNVDYDTPYYLLRLNGNFLVSYSDMYNVLNHGNVYELKKAGHASHVASYESVIKSANANGYPLSFTGERVNIVSADHCQDGSAREIYTLKIVNFIKPPRRSTRLAVKTAKGGSCKAKKHRKNKTRKSLL